MAKKKDTALAAQSYKADSIEVLEGLEAVRVRPGMYIGTTGPKGLHHILWEIIDNAVDEAANGYAKRIEVILNADGSATVNDDGRGIPVDIHPVKKVPAVELVFTQLHAGGKFNNNAYKTSGGLHGVGASVTNALSEWLKVDVYRDNKKYSMRFHSYCDKKGKWHSGEKETELSCEPYKRKSAGTSVTFLPDNNVFGDSEFDYETVENRVRELAFLNSGVVFYIKSERDGTENEFRYDGGISDYVEYLNENKETLFRPPVYISAENPEAKVKAELAFQYTDGYTENLYSYVNSIPTLEGGTHETGFKSALTRVMNDFARAAKLLKDKDDNLLGEDYREGITAVLSVKLANVQFEGQTKTKLGNQEVRPVIETLITEALGKYFEGKKEKKTGEIIVRKAIAAGKARMEEAEAKRLLRVKNNLDNGFLVGKLSACTGKDYSRNELYIVEGDSAGGSAKQARDRRFQAVLPLKGKPLNTEKRRLKTILENDEIKSIVSALGVGVGEELTMESLKYDKVIILSDADQDGAHIRAILLTFFFRYMKELLLEGHVYIGMPPLYKVTKGSTVIYCYDDNELNNAMAQAGRSGNLQRYKGLGEMNPSQLWDTTLNPETRSLVRVTLEDAAEADRLVTVLMGDSADARRDYISQYANFNKDKDAAIEKYKSRGGGNA
jgi:DNA gyrase subunit B